MTAGSIYTVAGTCTSSGSTGDTGASTGSVSVSYTWSAVSPVASCADADVILLDATLDEVGPAAPTVTGYACDDQGIEIEGLDPGSYGIEITAQSADGIRTWDSGPTVIQVVGGASTPVAVVLACSSTVSGGCG